MTYYGKQRSIGYNNYANNWDDDDYYSNRYSGYGKTSYKKTYTNWDWGTYNATSLVEEEDELFIANHSNYFTPTKYEVECRLPWGSTLKTKDNVKLIKEMSRFFFYKMMDEKNYIDPALHDDSKLSEELLAMKTQKISFYDELWDKYIPGFTPLEKAVNVFNQMVEKAKKEGKSDETIQNMIEEGGRSAVDDVKFDEDIYKDPIYNELLDMEMFSKRGFKKGQILNKIALIKNLGSQFKIEKDITEKIVQNSNIIAKKMMRDYSQVFNVDLYQRLFPDFKAKLLTKNLTINVPVEKTEHKQKIIMLLDFSGSMSATEKQEWVLAILVDRLKYCMLDEAEIFFSYFVDDPSALNFTHIHDRDSALAFWNKFSTRPNGGETYISKMISTIKDQINNKKKLCNLNIDLSEDQPEILIINDGQDSVKTDKFVYKTNALSLYENNDELKKLCVANNGKYVTISHQGGGSHTVNTYSKEGNEKLTI